MANDDDKSEKKDIYTGYSGTWVGGVDERKDKNEKPYGVAKLQLGENKTITVTAFGEGGVEKLKQAIADGVGVVHGYLSDAGIRFHEAGERTLKGVVANLRGGVSEKSNVAWADAIIINEGADNKKHSTVLKAFGEAAKIVNDAGDGATIEVTGHLTREKVKDDTYRAGFSAREVISVEPAAKMEKEADAPAL